MRFAEHVGFYGMTVWEWNLPAGYTCPGARDCISTVDPKTGTFDPKSKFRCYAAVARRIRDGEDYDDLKPSPFQVSRARL